MTIDLSAKVAFLRTPAAYPCDGPVEVIETHMSWVFLTERRVFKLKKPVRMPFVDYRTIERRRRYCEEELDLGRRLAASVYLDVVPLVAGPRGLSLGGDGEIVDWLVVMRRLDAELMVPQMLARGAATFVHADAIAEVLVAFYDRTRRATWNAEQYRDRLRSLIFNVAGELVARGAPCDEVGQVARAQLATIELHAGALAARIDARRVVDCHGDLRPEHVCLEMPPVAIDPLEFDPELRMMDVGSELSFLALECDRLGAAWFGERVIAHYIERSGDRVPARLIAFYRTQHALTRALIALRHLDDARAPDQARWRTKAGDYLARARVLDLTAEGSP